MDFDQAFKELIGHEGGFQKSPKDRGNWTSGVIGIGQLKGTKFGISAMSYPKEDIERLTLYRAKEIYKRDFWDRVKAGQLPAQVRFDVFDTAVNSGVTRSIQFLQRAVREKDDGILGPKTLLAVTTADGDELRRKFNAQRLLFLADVNSTTWAEFGRGLVKRVAANLSR